MKGIQKSLVVILFLKLVASNPCPEEHTGLDQQKVLHTQNSVPNHAINNVVTPVGLISPRPNFINIGSASTSNGPQVNGFPTDAPISNFTPEQRQMYNNYLLRSQPNVLPLPPMSIQQQEQGQQLEDYNRRLNNQIRFQNQYASQNIPRPNTAAQESQAPVPLQNFQFNNLQNVRQNPPAVPQPVNPSERPRLEIPTQTQSKLGVPVEMKPTTPVNPRQQIFNLIRNGYDFQQILLTNPTVKNVLATTKHQKRYMVIHPDGRVEHVDEIEAIAKKHPNHVLVSSKNLALQYNTAETKTIPVSESAPPVNSVPIEPAPVFSKIPTGPKSVTSSTTPSVTEAESNEALCKPIVSTETVVSHDVVRHEIVVPTKSNAFSESVTRSESVPSSESGSVTESISPVESVVSQEIVVPHKSSATFEAVASPETRTSLEPVPVHEPTNIFETVTTDKAISLQNDVGPIADTDKTPEIVTSSEIVITSDTVASSSFSSENDTATNSEHDTTTEPEALTSPKTVTLCKKYDVMLPSSASDSLVTTSYSTVRATSDTTLSDTTEGKPTSVMSSKANKITTADAATNTDSSSTSSSSSLSDTDSQGVSTASKQLQWFETSEAPFWDKLLEGDSINLLYFYYVPSQTANINEDHGDPISTNECSDEQTNTQASSCQITESQFWEDLFGENSVELIYFYYIPSQETGSNENYDEENNEYSASGDSTEEFTETKCNSNDDQDNKMVKPVRIIEPDGDNDGTTIKYQ